MIALVIGAAEGSLGENIANEFRKKLQGTTGGISIPIYSPVTAGIRGEERHLDLLDDIEVRECLEYLQPEVIVCTVGVNNSRSPFHSPRGLENLAEDFGVNFHLPIQLLHHAVQVGRAKLRAVVFISSNSAQIARRNSLGYCSSKAALSMAVRVAGRELAGQPLVWGYEFGLLKGTPMTRQTEAVFGPSQSRMIGAESGLETWQAARQVVSDVVGAWHGLNGVILRLDAGEQ